VKRFVVFVLALLLALSLASVAFAAGPVGTYTVDKTVGCGEQVVVDLALLNSALDWQDDFEARTDFTTGTKGYRGAGFIDSIKIDKNNKLVLTLRNANTLTEERVLRGEAILTSKRDSDFYYTVEYTLALHNAVVMVYGVKNTLADDLQMLFPAENTVFVCDQDSPGYALFMEGYLTGAVKFEAEEKVYLNLAYNDPEVDGQLYDYLGEALYGENIVETYTFVGDPVFRNPVELSMTADFKDAYHLYNWDGAGLTPIEATFDMVEGELEWKDAAPQTIVVSKVELLAPAESSATDKKNPDTGAAPAAEFPAVVLLAAALLGKKKN